MKKLLKTISVLLLSPTLLNWSEMFISVDVCVCGGCSWDGGGAVDVVY